MSRAAAGCKLHASPPSPPAVRVGGHLLLLGLTVDSDDDDAVSEAARGINSIMHKRAVAFTVGDPAVSPGLSDGIMALPLGDSMHLIVTPDGFKVGQVGRCSCLVGGRGWPGLPSIQPAALFDFWSWCVCTTKCVDTNSFCVLVGTSYAWNVFCRVAQPASDSLTLDAFRGCETPCAACVHRLIASSTEVPACRRLISMYTGE